MKTNIGGWALAIANAAFEADTRNGRWSFQFPVAWSGWDYFSRTRKLRMLSFQPEARWWALRKTNGNGLFIGPHLDLAWYNVAWGGKRRYQDHDRHTPAYGGGLTVGGRVALGKSGKWAVEASVGAGVMRLDYDIFQNHSDGLLLGREKKTRWGIDQAAVSIVYHFKNYKR